MSADEAAEHIVRRLLDLKVIPAYERRLAETARQRWQPSPAGRRAEILEVYASG